MPPPKVSSPERDASYPENNLAISPDPPTLCARLSGVDTPINPNREPMNHPKRTSRETPKVSFYEKRKKIHAKGVRGFFDNWRIGAGAAHPGDLLRRPVARVERPPGHPASTSSSASSTSSAWSSGRRTSSTWPSC